MSAASSISSVAATSSRPSAGNLVARLERDDVPGDELLGRDSTSSPPRRACALITSIFCSAATLSAALPSWFRPRTAFKHRQADDHHAGRELLERDDADDRGAEQDELHEVAVLAQERSPARLLLRLLELVRPEPLAPPLYLGGVEARGRIDAELVACLLRCEGVPGSRAPKSGQVSHDARRVWRTLWRLASGDRRMRVKPVGRPHPTLPVAMLSGVGPAGRT